MVVFPIPAGFTINLFLFDETEGNSMFLSLTVTLLFKTYAVLLFIIMLTETVEIPSDTPVTLPLLTIAIFLFEDFQIYLVLEASGLFLTVITLYVFFLSVNLSTDNFGFFTVILYFNFLVKVLLFTEILIDALPAFNAVILPLFVTFTTFLFVDLKDVFASEGILLN